MKGSLCIILVALAFVAESAHPCESAEIYLVASLRTVVVHCSKCICFLVGRVSGLADLTRHGDVSVRRVSRQDVLHLSCQCSSFTPQWHILTIEDGVTQTVGSPVNCEDNGVPCTNTYIPLSQAAPGKFTFLEYTLQPNQTTLIQCYNKFASDEEPNRDSVMLILEGKLYMHYPTKTKSPRAQKKRKKRKEQLILKNT